MDDEPLVLSSLRRLLMRERFEVSTCTSGDEALTILEKEQFDLIVSDYKMPGMNGIEFLRAVRPRWPDIPRCMLTAQADQEAMRQILGNLLDNAIKYTPSGGLVEVIWREEAQRHRHLLGHRPRPPAPRLRLRLRLRRPTLDEAAPADVRIPATPGGGAPRGR